MCDGFKPSQRKVLFACFKKNLKDEMKVAQLAAYVSETTAYHHGEVSLADTIVKMAHDYVGSNNVNYLEPCGQFGTRLMGGKDASQTRYIFTKLMPQTRKIFDPNDDAILNYLTDDGKPIEPEYFMPVLPTVLINGSEGIGTGFSCNVPPFNPEDIMANIRLALKGKTIKKMTPWYKDFKGTIIAKEDAWVASGVHSIRKVNDLTVTELPPGLWTQDFKEHLDVLVDKKTISGYKNNSTTESIHFEISGYQGKDPVKDFKLVKTIRVSNMHLFHPKQGIKKYQSAEEILVDFVELRIDYYKKRKAHLKKQLEQKVLVLTNKANFVLKVVNEEIKVFKRKKKDLEDEIAQEFPKVEGNHDYLLNIKTWQYTEEAVEAMFKEAKAAEVALKELEGTSIIQMWENNLLE